MVNTLFSYRKTKCSDRVEQSVLHSGTECSIFGNKVFAIAKQTVLCVETSAYIGGKRSFSDSIGRFLLYKCNLIWV